MNDHPRHDVLVAVSAALLLAQAIGAAHASPATPPPAAMPSFTAAQADSGATVYATKCVLCHGAALQGYAGPALSGATFLDHWLSGDKTVADLHWKISTQMPYLAPHTLPAQDYLDVTAFLLSRNGFHPGGTPLDSGTLPVPLPRPPGAPPAVPINLNLPSVPESPGRARGTQPGDDELIQPPDTAWPSYNRSLAGDRYSGLREINVRNARSLQVVCAFQLGETGSFQASPIVYDGTIYVTGPYSTFAIDAADCHKRWEHQYPADMSPPLTVNRGVALYRGKVLRVTPNNHLLALDAATGELLWDVWVTDKAAGRWMSLAPVAFDGRVYIGEAGADWGANGHLYAFDVDTGRRLWTFNTIPTGTEPGADTWQKGAESGGGSTWSSFAVDAAEKLVYAPVGNPSPDFNGAMRPGDNLYTDSVVALDAASGRLRWYVQQTPHDTHDWDTAAAPALYEQGGRRFMTVGSKAGYLFIYDRDTHALVAKVPVTTHDNDSAPITVAGTHHCPGFLGGVLWNGAAYSPASRRLFVNSVDWCGTTQLTEARFLAGVAFMSGEHALDPIETAHGWTRAVDAASGKELWARRAPAPMVAALTPTAGGVVFTGEMSGEFLALDAATGAVLYHFNTGGALAGAASTYRVGQRQYVAVTSGNNSKITWQARGAATVFVFALPER
jgi:PQQ-dependent dehydrogenase (methanol/ethanol family)